MRINMPTAVMRMSPVGAVSAFCADCAACGVTLRAASDRATPSLLCKPAMGATLWIRGGVRSELLAVLSLTAVCGLRLSGATVDTGRPDSSPLAAAVVAWDIAAPQSPKLTGERP